MEVFEQPQCSASFDTTPRPMSALPRLQQGQDPQLPYAPARTPHNYAALVFSGSIGTFLVAVLAYVWYRSYRLKARERRRIRAALERIKAKQAANGQGRVPRTVAALRALRECIGRILAMLESLWVREVDDRVPVSEGKNRPDPSPLADDAKSKRKRTKEKVKRVKTRPTGSTQAAPSKIQKPLTVSDRDVDNSPAVAPLSSTIPTFTTAPVTDAESRSDNSEETIHSVEFLKVSEEHPPSLAFTVSTPQPSLISIDTPKDVDDTPRIPQPSTLIPSPNMSLPASPMKDPVTIPVLHSLCPSPTPSLSSCGSLSHGRLSRSASVSSITASSTAAPVTPPSRLVSLPVKYELRESWDSEHVPDDSAWDWDGQRSLHTVDNSRHPVRHPVADSTPSLLLTPDLPAVVFPSLNGPPPAPTGSSSSSQILSLKSAVKMGKQREMRHRCEVEALIKQRDFANWRFHQAQEAFQRRERELQAEISRLAMQLQGYAIQSPQFIQPPQFPPGQQFPLYYSGPTSPYPHASPFLYPYPSPQSPVMNEIGVSDKLAEAILRHPESIRSSTSNSTKNEEREDVSSSSQSQGSGEASPIHRGSPCSDAIELVSV
ncbi:hypothetical protein BU17DRAFT_61143 [Hysterangium stoloniferum]|nr:hypothetical protein BU17DRAFT_61143 [Hysterangium stoloniferum]